MTDARGGADEAATGRAQNIDAATAELAHCREEIERIDNEIIGLLARRLVLGKRTATLKRAAGLPILDPTREAAVIRRVAGVARDAGLPSEPIREVFWQIVGMSRRAQQEEVGGGGGGTVSGSGTGEERAP